MKATEEYYIEQIEKYLKRLKECLKLKENGNDRMA